MRGETCIKSGRRLLLWGDLVDLNKVGTTDLIRLLTNAFDHIRARSQRVFEFLKHLVSLLLNDVLVSSERGRLRVLHAVVID